MNTRSKLHTVVSTVEEVLQERDTPSDFMLRFTGQNVLEQVYRFQVQWVSPQEKYGEQVCVSVPSHVQPFATHVL